MAIGYVRLWRQQEFWDLVKDHRAFALAAVIAMRARRTAGLNMNGLDVGEALLGDYREYGMSEGQYRAAKQRLESAGFATFRTTNKGTIASLIFTGVFDPNLEQSNEPDNRPITDSFQRASDEPDSRPATSRATTKKDNEKENENSPCRDGGPAAAQGSEQGIRNIILHRPEMARRVELSDERDLYTADPVSLACTICAAFPDTSGRSGPHAGKFTLYVKELGKKLGDEVACALVRKMLIQYWAEIKSGEDPELKQGGSRINVLLSKTKRLLEAHGCL